MSKFVSKLARIQREKGTKVGLLLRPQVTTLPLPMLRYDDPFLPYSRSLIDALRDHLCACVFDLAAYMALGAAGIVALERSIAAARAGDDLVTVLHGPFASSEFAPACGADAFSVDGVTVTDVHLIDAFAVERGGGGVFVVSPTDLGAEISRYDEVGGMLLPADAALAVYLKVDAAVCVSRGDDFAEAARAAAIDWLHPERRAPTDL